MPKISITSVLEKERLIITIDGELDASTCIMADKEFEKVLSSGAKAIFADCRELEYISSAGIGVLISFNHDCEEKGINLCFCEMQPKVKNVLEILGIDKVFTIEASLKEALESTQHTKK